MEEDLKKSIIVIHGGKKLLLKAKIISLNTNTQTDSNGRKYIWANIRAYMPNNTTQIGSTKIWENYYSDYKYKKNDIIDIAVNLEGNYIGHSQIYKKKKVEPKIIKKEEPFIFEAEILKICNKIYVNSENIEFIKAKVKVKKSGLKDSIKNVFIWNELKKEMEYEKTDCITATLLFNGKYKGLSHIFLGKSIKGKWVNYNFDFYKPSPKRIKKISIGIPKKISKKIKWVSDLYRTNDLSIIPGGFDIIIEYYSGEVLGYDKVKNLNAYIKCVILNEINYSDNQFDDLENNIQIKLIREKIKRIFFRNQDYSLIFDEFWDSSVTKIPWNSSLKKEKTYKAKYDQYDGPSDGYGGHLDDDFINDVLDGKPDAYWNID